MQRKKRGWILLPLILCGLVGFSLGLGSGRFLWRVSGESSPSTLIPPAQELPLPAPAENQKSWRMVSAFPSSSPQFGSQGTALSRKIARVSAGTLELKFFEPGTLVPPGEIFDAVASGEVEAAWVTSVTWSEMDPALPLFGAIPFGPPADRYLAWIFHGGGRELMQEIYGRFEILPLVCGVTGPEGAGWFRRPLQEAAALDGLPVRVAGLAMEVMARLGARPRSIAGGEIFQAFQLGQIDAAEFSTPAIDLMLGFHQLTKHYYFPGWHQPATLLHLLIHRDSWNQLTAAERQAIDLACGDNLRQGLIETGPLQTKALRDLVAKGVHVAPLPAPVLAALKQEWQSLVAERAEESESFARVYRSYQDFLAGEMDLLPAPPP